MVARTLLPFLALAIPGTFVLCQHRSTSLRRRSSYPLNTP